MNSKKVIKTIGLTTKPLEDLIKKGSTLDFRLNEPLWKDLKVGGIVEFLEDPTKERSVICEIENLYTDKTFPQLINNIPESKLNRESKRELLKNLYMWWTKEEEEKYGVLAMKIKVIKVKNNKLSHKQRLKNRLEGNFSSYSRILEQVDLQKNIHGEWSGKDIVGHITTWTEEAVKSLEAYSNESEYTSSYASGEAFNHENVSNKSELRCEEIVKAWNLIHGKLLKFVNNLDESRFEDEMMYPFGKKGRVEHLIDHMLDHEDAHFKDIMEYFADKRSV